ncbi:TPA: hypothetical protein RQM97_004122 [Aeromonas dhakensis]|uniref:hypothetical protein n=1 Tax=Aeromonas TaxID=642 RepID=UPI000A9ACFF6|nr:MULTISPECIES: hypothetical protein [Aeromonas]UCM60469.1 hypothetical protein LEO78_14620 [Aeromonas hydrophila]HDX8356084.1 hypothetical protein [Aeromonas dhakensis]
MAISIFDPSIICIDEHSWVIEEERDSFLDNLLSSINILDEYKYSKLAWTYDIDDEIWSSPQTPPWRNDAVYSNTITPILYKKLPRIKEYIDCNQQEICLITPPLYTPNVRIYNEIRKIISSTIDTNTVLFHAGPKNTPFSKFKIECGEYIPLTIPYIDSPSNYFKLINVEQHFWPKNHSDKNSLKMAIEISWHAEFNYSTPCPEFDMSDAFVKKLSQVRNDKKRILKTITKRLSLSSQEARLDGSLQEELIDKEFRIRVSLEKRIHLIIKNKKITFMMFYDSGEHDDGL